MTQTNKSLFRFLVLILLVSSFNSCAEKKGKEEEKAPDEKASQEIKAPANIISLEQADSIYTNYSKHRAAVIERYETQERAPQENFEASRFVDFDYDSLKNYIAYVDQEAKKAGVKKVTKLRLYFANYPDKDEFPNGKKVVHKRQNSIFMLPTMDMEGVNYGFFIGSDGKAELISNWKTQMEKGMGVYTNSENKAYAGFVPANAPMNANLQESKSLTLNYGGSGPPPKTDFQ